MDPLEIITLSTPITMAIVEGIKRSDVKKVLDPHYWLLSLVVGILINFGAAYYANTDWFIAIMSGIIAGLSASGLYSGGKTALKK